VEEAGLLRQRRGQVGGEAVVGRRMWEVGVEGVVRCLMGGEVVVEHLRRVELVLAVRPVWLVVGEVVLVVGLGRHR
jgi:hypothetical protein